MVREAGVKIDIVAGRGVGAVGAMFAAINGGSSLWDEDGVWRSERAATLYAWRATLQAACWTLAIALAALTVPLLALVGASVVYPVSLLLQTVGLDAGGVLAGGYTCLVEAVFEPSALPLYLPRFVMMALLILLVLLVVGETWPALRRRPRRRARGWMWWRLLGAPLSNKGAAEHFTTGLWRILRGAARIEKPASEDLAERYGELLSENLGQPGFRELLVTVHDLDGRRDLVFALLKQEFGRSFFARRLGAEGGQRHLETMDLRGPARSLAVDALTAGLCLPVATDAHPVQFAWGGVWQGETHHLCDRPEATTRLLEEVANAGAEQVILVTALPDARGPHLIQSRRRDPKGRAGEHLAALETASVRDALVATAGRFQAVFQVRPEHNPLGMFDFDGGYDESSDRQCTLSELVNRGHEDGFRQFIDPVVGASGEWIQTKKTGEANGSVPVGPTASESDV